MSSGVESDGSAQPKIRHVMIDGALVPDEVNERQIMAVPTVFLNGAGVWQGRMSVEEIVANWIPALRSEAAKSMTKHRLTSWSVGGGPAGWRLPFMQPERHSYRRRSGALWWSGARHHEH